MCTLLALVVLVYVYTVSCCSADMFLLLAVEVLACV